MFKNYIIKNLLSFIVKIKKKKFKKIKKYGY